MYKKILQAYKQKPNSFYKGNFQLLDSYLFDYFFRNKQFKEASYIIAQASEGLVNLPKPNFDKPIEEKISYVKISQIIEPSLLNDLYQEIDWSYQFPVKKNLEDLKQLQQELNNLKTKKNFPKKGEISFQILEKIVAIETEFQQGKWVELLFDKQLALWRTYSGKFKQKNKYTVIGSNNFKEQSQYLAHRAFFTPPFEVKLTVKTLENFAPAFELPTGLIIGKMHSPIFGRYLYINEQKKIAAIYDPYDKENKFLSSISLSKKDSYNLYAKVYKDKVRFWVDNQEIKIKKANKFSPLLVSLGVVPLGAGKVEYSNIKIRQLTTKKRTSNEPREDN